MRAEQVQGVIVCSASIALGVLLLVPEKHQPAALRNFVRKIARYRVWLGLSIILLGVVTMIDQLRH